MIESLTSETRGGVMLHQKNVFIGHSEITTGAFSHDNMRPS